MGIGCGNCSVRVDRGPGNTNIRREFRRDSVEVYEKSAEKIVQITPPVTQPVDIRLARSVVRSRGFLNLVLDVIKTPVICIGDTGIRIEF